MTVQPRYLTNGELVWLVVLESRPPARIYYTADGRNPPKMQKLYGRMESHNKPSQKSSFWRCFRRISVIPIHCSKCILLLPDFSIFSGAPPFLFLVLSLLSSLARANPRQIAVLWSDLTNHQAILIYFLYSYHTLWRVYQYIFSCRMSHVILHDQVGQFLTWMNYVC